jgi:outer membrane protein OmpA-like peptidoglycan-associated protein
VRIKKLLVVATAFVCTVVFATGQAFADDADDDIDGVEDEWVNNVPPMSYWGLRGLTQTVSAEPGLGRLNFSLFWSYFQQYQDLSFGRKRDEGTYGPPKGSTVNDLVGKISWGANKYTDLFGCLPMYILDRPGKNVIVSFPTELMGGAQFVAPIPEEIPFRLAGQVKIIYGLKRGDDTTIIYNNRGTKVNTNNDVTYGPDYLKEGEGDVSLTYAGYDYENARKRDNIALVLKLAQTVPFVDLPRFALKLHINEGIDITPGVTGTYLLLLAAGLEIDPTEYLTIGGEINWRTPLNKEDEGPSFKDPLWFTPSVMFRSPYYANGLVGMNFVIGADIRMSSAKPAYNYKFAYYDESTKEHVLNEKNNIVGEYVKDAKGQKVQVGDAYPLEPYRLFADLVFSFDLLASKRAEMARQAKANAAEKARLKKMAAMTAAQRDSIAAKAREDSLAQVAALAAKAEKARQDSIALAAEAAEREAKIRAEAEGREAQLRAAAEGREAQLRAQAEQKRIADSIALADVNKRLAEEKAKRSAAEQQMLSTGMLVLDGVFFVTGKAEIQLNSRGYLTTLAKMLVRYPKLRMEIGGHTDNTGSLQTNIELSQRRAEAVFMFLHNIEPSLSGMLSTKGYGPTVPKADNSTAAGREVNRRVEIRVLNPDVLREYNP